MITLMSIICLGAISFNTFANYSSSDVYGTPVDVFLSSFEWEQKAIVRLVTTQAQYAECIDIADNKLGYTPEVEWIIDLSTNIWVQQYNRIYEAAQSQSTLRFLWDNDCSVNSQQNQIPLSSLNMSW